VTGGVGALKERRSITAARSSPSVIECAAPPSFALLPAAQWRQLVRSVDVGSLRNL